MIIRYGIAVMLLLVLLGPGEAVAFDLQAEIDAAGPGDTITVPCGEHPQPGQVVIDKELTIRGDEVCSPRPQLTFSDAGLGNADAVSVRATGVVIDNLRLLRDGHGSYYAIVSVPHVGWPPTYPYGDLTVTDCVFEHGRYGLYVRGAGDLTVTNCLFDNQYRDSIILAGYEGGTASITGNTFDGTIRAGKKALLIENASDQDQLEGTISFSDNVINGKHNGVVYNFWVDPITRKVDLHLFGNDIVTNSGAVAFYYTDCGASDIFQKLATVLIGGNSIYDSGRAVYLDGNAWCGLSAPAPADGQIVVAGNDVCNITGDDTDTCIVVVDEHAFCHSEDAGTLGATLAAFAASDNTACGAGAPMACYQVHESRVSFGGDEDEGDDRFEADGTFLTEMPAPADAVALALDGIDVVGPVLFEEFTQKPGRQIYDYRSDDGAAHLRLDWEKCRWKAKAKEIELGALDNPDGVTHLLSVGGLDGTEDLFMIEHPKHWSYKADDKTDCCDDQDEGGDGL